MTENLEQRIAEIATLSVEVAEKEAQLEEKKAALMAILEEEKLTTYVGDIATVSRAVRKSVKYQDKDEAVRLAEVLDAGYVTKTLSKDFEKAVKDGTIAVTFASVEETPFLQVRYK